MRTLFLCIISLLFINSTCYAYEATCIVETCVGNECKGPFNLSLTVNSGILIINEKNFGRSTTTKLHFNQSDGDNFSYFNNNPNRSQFDIEEVHLGKFDDGEFVFRAYDASEVYIKGICTLKK